MILPLSECEEGIRFQRRGIPHFLTRVVDWLPESIYAYNNTMTAGPPCKKGSTSREVWPETPSQLDGRSLPGPYWIADNWMVEIL